MSASDEHGRRIPDRWAQLRHAVIGSLLASPPERGALEGRLAALAAQAHGEDWYAWTSPKGASLPRSLDWLSAYARGEKTHIEFARSKIQFDRDRAASGQKEYAPHPWDVANAVGTVGFVGIAAAGVPAHTSGGVAVALACGAYTAIFAVLQYLGVRRLA